MSTSDEGDKPKTNSTDLISLAEGAKLTGLSQSHLRMLVRDKKVWGLKIGRNWLTTEAAIRDYLATDRKPGPKKNG